MKIKRITTEIDLQAALEIRKAVFIEEQQVPESDEFDQFDTLEDQCGHVLVFMKISLPAQDASAL